MHRLAAGLALILTLESSLAFAAEPKKVALLVGVNKYQKRNLADLRYAERDMEELASQLQRLGFETTLLRGSAAGPRQATRQNIDLALKELLADMGKEDIVLIALAGHGVEQEMRQADGSTKQDAFFCPANAVLSEPQTMLSLSYLIDDVLANKGGRNLLLIDACRDQAREVATRGVQGRRVDLPENTAILFACSAGQTSVESPRLGGGHGAFTYCVLEALRGRPEASGDLTWSEVVATVETLMASSPELQNVLANAPPQDPIHAGHVKRTVLGKGSGAPVLSRIQHPADPTLETYVNSVGMKLVRIPPGEFTMGTPESDADLLAAFPAAKGEEFADERPAHRVRISRPFFMGMHEVTLEQFGAFTAGADYVVEAIRDGKGGWGYTGDPENPRKQSPDFSPWQSGFDYWSNHPVVNVTWNDAQEFCAWLSKKEQLTYRLPTEAEWEYACRAGTSTRYWTGDEPEALAAAENVADASLGDKFSRLIRLKSSDGFPFTAAVGSLRPNPFGLYDMQGNVSEWCADGYDARRYQAGEGRVSVDPRSPADQSPLRILRGGGWDSKPHYSRSAFRFHYSPSHRYYSDGFRVVLERP